MTAVSTASARRVRGSQARGRSHWECERALRERGHNIVAGVDEVGRGPLAGPVLAAAVILPSPSRAGEDESAWIGELRDSKLLSARTRERLADIIRLEASWALAYVSPHVIDQINIRQATRLAMKNAVEALPTAAEALIIDGRDVIEVSVPQVTVVGGDASCVSVAAASILAKVTRDRLMCELDGRFPGYGLAVNKGYGTAAHRAALSSLGYTTIHRLSFAPVRQALGGRG
ncbi:MAG: ribonuclease HII [Chloroflexi bacterium]|nr:ribonuclease HII [Chloroflexota bacterium]